MSRFENYNKLLDVAKTVIANSPFKQDFFSGIEECITRWQPYDALPQAIIKLESLIDDIENEEMEK